MSNSVEPSTTAWEFQRPVAWRKEKTQFFRWTDCPSACLPQTWVGGVFLLPCDSLFIVWDQGVPLKALWLNSPLLLHRTWRPDPSHPDFSPLVTLCKDLSKVWTEPWLEPCAWRLSEVGRSVRMTREARLLRSLRWQGALEMSGRWNPQGLSLICHYLLQSASPCSILRGAEQCAVHHCIPAPENSTCPRQSP